MRTRTLIAVGSVVGATLLTGCGPDARDLPLPGTTVPGDSFIISAEFEDALNLAIGAKVKVNGIDVGRVKDVTNEGFHAIASLRVKETANIHEGATARLRYNTPLGELFVDIASPKTGKTLGDGDKMVPPVTSTAPTVEDALASASLLINNGGLEQLQTITEEFQKAVGTRGPTIRQLLDRSATFLQAANTTTQSIDRALTALAGASATLNARQDIINRAVREITPAARVLRENTDELVVLLQEAVKLAQKANGLIGASRQSLLATIKELGPVLDTFYSLRGRFNEGLRELNKLGKLLNSVVPGTWGPVVANVELSATQFANAGTKSSKSSKSTNQGTQQGQTQQSGPLAGLGLPPGLLQGLGLPPLLGLTRTSPTGVSR